MNNEFEYLKESIRLSSEEAIKKAKLEWYERGKRDGREEAKAALREWLDVERIEK